MNKGINVDLHDLSDILEGFNAKKKDMSEADLIDLAARIKPAGKAIKEIDEYVKDVVKTKLKHKAGFRNGGLFRAILKLVPMPRLDQKALKENDLKVYNKYVRDDTDERVTFELR